MYRAYSLKIKENIMVTIKRLYPGEIMNIKVKNSMKTITKLEYKVDRLFVKIQ